MALSKLRIESFTISLDGFGAGPNQSIENPLGVGGSALHEWAFSTSVFQKQLLGVEGGSTGPDNDFAARGFSNVGAWILGRNMFGPIRGPWPDDRWKGWWGDNPPYHTPAFVLTHHAREPAMMEGGTTFHFVTDGIHSALDRATEAADGLDVRLGGGVATVRQYLRAGLVDEMHVAIAPILLGSGESLFAGIDMVSLGYRCVEHIATQHATHVVLKKTGQVSELRERPSIVRDTKEWWAQVDALNSLLMMSDLFPDDTMAYYDRFCAQWHFCKSYVLDHERGGWYWGGLDKSPAHRIGPKGTIWKRSYHTSRALINCIRRLTR